MYGHGRATPVRTSELFVGATLSHLGKAELLEQADHFAGLENWRLVTRTRSASGDEDSLDANELGVEARLAVLQEKRDDLTQV